MPFTFKPDIGSDQAGAQAATPQAALGPSTMSLMTRAQEGGKSIIQLILMAAFGLSVLTAIGMFVYSYYLSSQVDNKKAQLDSYEQQLGALPLDDMRALSNRIKVITQLVNQHPSANVAFRILEDSIENPVTYTQFSLRYDASGKNYKLDLRGKAPDYKSVAQQFDTFGRDPYKEYVGDLRIQGLSPDDKGNIQFGVSMPIKIAGLLPEDLNLSQGAAALIASTTPDVASSTASTTQSGAAASSTPPSQ